jgi:hypothetical protein
MKNDDENSKKLSGILKTSKSNILKDLRVSFGNVKINNIDIEEEKSYDNKILIEELDPINHNEKKDYEKLPKSILKKSLVYDSTNTFSNSNNIKTSGENLEQILKSKNKLLKNSLIGKGNITNENNFDKEINELKKDKVKLNNFDIQSNQSNVINSLKASCLLNEQNNKEKVLDRNKKIDFQIPNDNSRINFITNNSINNNNVEKKKRTSILDYGFFTQKKIEISDFESDNDENNDYKFIKQDKNNFNENKNTKNFDFTLTEKNIDKNDLKKNKDKNNLISFNEKKENFNKISTNNESNKIKASNFKDLINSSEKNNRCTILDINNFIKTNFIKNKKINDKDTSLSYYDDDSMNIDINYYNVNLEINEDNKRKKSLRKSIKFEDEIKSIFDNEIVLSSDEERQNNKKRENNQRNENNNKINSNKQNLCDLNNNNKNYNYKIEENNKEYTDTNNDNHNRLLSKNFNDSNITVDKIQGDSLNEINKKTENVNNENENDFNYENNKNNNNDNNRDDSFLSQKNLQFSQVKEPKEINECIITPMKIDLIKKINISNFSNFTKYEIHNSSASSNKYQNFNSLKKDNNSNSIKNLNLNSKKNNRENIYSSIEKKIYEKEKLFSVKSIKLNDSNPSNSFINGENISFLLLNQDNFIEIFDINKSSIIKNFKKICENLNSLNYNDNIQKEDWNFNSIIKKTNLINENYFKFLISIISEKEKKIEKIISIIKQKNQNFSELKNEVEKLDSKKIYMEQKIKNFIFSKIFFRKFEEFFNFFCLKFFSSIILNLEFNKLSILFYKKMIFTFEFVELDYISFYNKENFAKFFEDFHTDINENSNSLQENFNHKNKKIKDLFDFITFSIRNMMINDKQCKETNHDILINPKLLLKNITFKFNEDFLFNQSISNNKKDINIFKTFNKIFIYILNELFTDKNKKYYEISFLQFIKHYKELTKIGVSVLFLKNELNFFKELFDEVQIEFIENEEIVLIDFLIKKSKMKINFNFNVSIFDCFYEYQFNDFYLENLNVPENEYEEIKTNYDNLSKQIKELLNQRHNFPHPFFFRNFITNIRNVIISDNFN